jgi:hypothetical protein
MKRAVVSLLGLVLLVALCACQTPPPAKPIAPFFAEGPYTYTVTNDAATITRFDTSYSGTLAITDTLGRYPVTSIGFAAFHNCGDLTSVTIPASVTSIGHVAFSHCAGLTSITLPDSVTEIGVYAFDNCSSLTTVTVDPASPSFSSLNGVLFNRNQTTILHCPGAKVGSYTIPAGVTSIGNYAFKHCAGLTSVTIPDNVTTIGHRAFSGCSSLTSVTIPDSVIAIGHLTFSGCTHLNRVYFVGNAPSLGHLVFDSTPATIYYRPGTTGWGPTYGGRPTAVWTDAATDAPPATPQP